MHDIIVGNGEGQVPLKKLRTTLLKLPRVLTGPQVTAANDRLRAMGDLMSNMPLPKGPMPKGMRMPRGGEDALTRTADSGHRRRRTARGPAHRRPGPLRVPVLVSRASRLAPVAARVRCRDAGPDLTAPRPVVQAAAVAVPDQGRDGQAAAAPCAGATPHGAEPAAVLGDDPQAAAAACPG